MRIYLCGAVVVMLGVERRRMDGSCRFSVGIVVSGPKNVPDPFSSPPEGSGSLIVRRKVRRIW